MKCDKLVCKFYLFKTVIVVGCMVVDHRTHILSPGVLASFEDMERGEERGEKRRGEEGRGGQREKDREKRKDGEKRG